MKLEFKTLLAPVPSGNRRALSITGENQTRKISETESDRKAYLMRKKEAEISPRELLKNLKIHRRKRIF